MAQSAYTSTAGDGGLWLNISGGAYAGVSTSRVTEASRCSARTASPKSASTAELKCEWRMLAGFTSRCSTPAACEWASASAILMPRSRASTGPSGEVRIRSAYEPSQSSMIR
ncbi:hypothetical protein PSN01_04598 [Micromonospora saelicesensis]|nr:hypothetical protein PSN01_04598 [Micromonospora saelicesensis]